MAKVYSTRFIEIWGSAGDHTYTVPAGYKAIVQTVAVVNLGAAVIHAALQRTGANVCWYAPVPATGGAAVVTNLRAVFGPGEVIDLNTSDVAYGSCHGYLFNAT